MARRCEGPWFRESKQAWYATVEGRMVSLGVKGSDKEAEAVKAWHRLMAGATEKAKPKPKPEPTVAEVVKRFLEDCEGRVKAKTMHDYNAFLTAFAGCFGKMEGSALTTATAEQYARKPTWGPSTQNDFLAILSAAFKWAERIRLIDRTPLVGLRKPPKGSRGEKSVVGKATVDAILNATDSEFAALVRFLWLTGCRPSEAANLTTANVSLPDRRAVLTEHKTAHRGKVRIIYFTEEAVAVLRRQSDRHGDGYLFRRPSGGKWTTHSVTGKFARVCRKAGVKTTAYCLRHTFATDALANGVPDAHVAELMGHSGTGTLHRHYNHLTARSQSLREALSKVR